MLINDLKPTSGDIIINGQNIKQNVMIPKIDSNKSDDMFFVVIVRNMIWKLAFVHNLIGSCKISMFEKH